MGTNIRSQIVVGVHLSPVMEQVSRTKYNEDTGQSYEKIEPNTFFVIEGTKIKVHPENMKGEIKVVHGHDRYSYFLGIVAIETQGFPFFAHPLWAECQPLEPLQSQVADFLRKEFQFDREPGIFVLTFIL